MQSRASCSIRDREEASSTIKSRLAGARVHAIQLNGEELLIVSLPISDSENLDLLTEAERSVVQGIMGGGTNAEIARRRGTSTRTVVNQVAAIFRKLNCRSRAELVARVRGTAIE